MKTVAATQPGAFDGAGTRLTWLSVALVAACSAPPAPREDAGAGDAEIDGGARDATALDASAVPRPRALPLSCAAATGASQDLLALARLAAGPTRRSGGVVREDHDGPGTLRDDDDASGWVPAPAEIATLEIDLAPGLERPVALDTLAITSSGPALTDVHAYVLEACGGGVVADFAWADTAQPLSLAGTCGTCVELDLRAASGARLLSVALSSRDATIALPAALPDPPATPPVPTHAESGVIEGFYGPPWSFTERARMLDAISVAGMGTYLYAPKDDPLHRSAWRTPYDAATVARFATLASIARGRGVRFLFGVSPFLDFDASVDADYDALATKLRTLLDAGVSGIAILADDLLFASAPTDGALGAMHASVVTRVVSELGATHPGVVVWFVPTVYDDAQLSATPHGAEYLMALRALPPEVRVLWTGTDVGSTTLTGADLANVRALIGRDPIVWDNAWANDVGGALSAHELLGTYEGRDAALRAATHGIDANPLVQGSLARLPAAMLGAWLAAGRTGDAARSAAADLESRYLWRPEPDAQETLVRLMEANDGTFTVAVTHRRLEGALGRMVTDAATGTPAQADLVLALDAFAGMATLGGRVHHGAFDAELGDELAYPLASLAEEGLAGLALLDVLTARLGGADPSVAEAAVRAHRVAAGRASRFAWSDLVTTTLEGLASVAVDRGLRAPSSIAVSDPTCVAGVPLTLDAFATGEVRAYGLPGATVSGTSVSFTAPHPGRFAAVITARDPSGGVAWRALDVVCVPGR